MKPDDIPADIWSAARDLAAQYHKWMDVQPEDDHVLPQSIARAILAERERCAGVARRRADLRNADKVRYAASIIATEILQGDTDHA